jgi:O-antigen/teichoic acid export membrane protein
MTIDAYLAQLERRLPRISRRRILAEAQEHLRDSAARHSAAGLVPHTAEAAAVADFGPVEIVARRLAAAGAIRETRIATLVALGAVAFFVFPLYVVPENTLPPAPWVEKPRDIFLLQLASVGLWIAAGALTLAAVALSWTRWSRLSSPALTCALIVLAGSVAGSAVLVVRWFALTPATPNWALAAPLAAVCLVACAGAALWARASRRRLVVQD